MRALEDVLVAASPSRPRGAELVGGRLCKVLSDVLVSPYDTGATTPSVPSSRSARTFSKIAFSYRPRKADGSLGPAVTGSWDLKAGRP
jgi:hypothetical protein